MERKIEEEETMSAWKTFYFDSNQCWGIVDSPDKFKKMLADYGGNLGDFLTAKRTMVVNGASIRTFRDMPNFGFRSEHVGPQTLAEWLGENNISPKFLFGVK